MKLWLVTPNNFDYDEYVGFVVRASSKQRAEEMARNVSTNNGMRSYVHQVWTAKPITVAGGEEVVLDSFHAG